MITLHVEAEYEVDESYIIEKFGEAYEEFKKEVSDNVDDFIYDLPREAQAELVSGLDSPSFIEVQAY